MNEKIPMRLEQWDPRIIKANPLNWRTHGMRQRQALSDLLDEVGFLKPVLFNERTGQLIDGHMRVEEYIERNEEKIPVLVIDVPKEDEDKAVYFMDRIGEMAGADTDIEAELNALINSESDLLNDIAAGDQAALLDAENESDDDGERIDKMGVGLVAGEKFGYVVLLFRTELDFNGAIEHFGLEKKRDPFNRDLKSRIKMGQVIDGSAYLNKIKGATT